MLKFLRPSRQLAAFGLSAAVLLGSGLLMLRGERAQAQGVMSTPACQCSAATAIPSLSTNVVHCLCGAMSCVISEHGGQAKATNLMQCVK
jgi:hypothetical protein